MTSDNVHRLDNRQRLNLRGLVPDDTEFVIIHLEGDTLIVQPAVLMSVKEIEHLMREMKT